MVSCWQSSAFNSLSWQTIDAAPDNISSYQVSYLTTLVNYYHHTVNCKTVVGQYFSLVISHEKQPITTLFQKLWLSVIGWFSREMQIQYFMTDNRLAIHCMHRPNPINFKWGVTMMQHRNLWIIMKPLWFLCATYHVYCQGCSRSTCKP